jgi:tetratricopeptide (TPR) repeat protein
MRRIVGLMLWLGCLVFNLPCALADQGHPVWQEAKAAETPPPLFAFAQSLFDAGDYYRAVGEWQRFLFFQPQHPRASQAQLGIALAYFCGERWLQAYEVFRQVTRVAPDPASKEAAALGMAESQARRGAHGEAIRLYGGVIATYPGTPTADRAAYLRAWSQLWLRQWEEARHPFAAIAETSPYYPSGQRLAAALDPLPTLPRRSPTVAQVLSTILPGAGQIYTGQTIDGLIGLGVHGALIAGTTGAVLAGLKGAGGIGAFVTWGFYRTQRGNAAVSAREFNTQAEERFLGQLAAQEERYLRAFVASMPCAP